MVHLQAISVEGQESVVTDYILKIQLNSTQTIFIILIPNSMSPALGNGQAVISEEALRQKQANRTGEGVEPSLTGSNSPKRGTTKGRSQSID
ncbi:hypothetical protein BHM03_00013649 [Ensete ventricosum]|nr:hypothetical protein BHM03_00013649 [Ensete ventricosum]